MTIDTVYKIVQFAVNKAQNGYLTPEEFNLCINNGQRGYAAYLLGTMQQYTPGRPIARVELGQNSVVRQRLTPIIYGYNLPIDTTGFSPYPGDYLQTDAMWSIYGYQRIRYADQHKFVSIYNSRIDPIRRYPIYVLEDVGFRFFPSTLSDARLNYVRNPPDMRWGYVNDANGLPLYSEAHSTQPVFDDAAMMEIIVRALALVGVNLQAAQVSQYAEQIKQGGQ